MKDEILLLKMIKDTKVFSKGQKVWACYSTGALACRAIGRYKKHGRWLSCYVHWIDPSDKTKTKSFSGNADCKWICWLKTKPSFSRFINNFNL